MSNELDQNDHRRLGPALGLFHIQDDAAGSVFWHEKGWTLFQTIEAYIRSEMKAGGYGEVRTPQLYDRTLFAASGHLNHYANNMFQIDAFRGTKEQGGPVVDLGKAFKPMNCPGHVQIFNKKNVSYRDLPLRMSEFGCCHRNEPSGSLHGIMRLRQFTQDDAHIFCAEDQVGDEALAFIKMLRRVYERFGFEVEEVALSLRPDSRAGEDALWDRAESALEMAVVAAGLPYRTQAGEGAFYGPKLEFSLKDCMGRVWQCGTIQLDFVLPERLGAHYTDRDGQKKHPVMLHRAILGSLERFIGILLEHYEGKLPTWLAPVQAVVIAPDHKNTLWADQIVAHLEGMDVRVVLDARDENMKQKVKDHSLMSVPYIIVAGAKDMAKSGVMLRTLGSDEIQFVKSEELGALFR